MTRGPAAAAALAIACAACTKSSSEGVPESASAAAAGTAPPAASVAASLPDSPAAPAPAEETVATMRLLEPGAAPRRVLRYAWRTKQAETLTMDLRTAASTEEGATKQPEIELPPVRILVAIDPKGVSSDGDLSFAWHVTSAEVTADPQAPASLAAGMSAEVAEVERLAGTGVVTSRGLSKGVTLDAPPPAHAAANVTGQMVEQVRQTLRDVAAPLPEEAVGAGARWEKLSQLASRDARVAQTETFKLTEATGDAGSLAYVLAQTAPPQPLVGPGAADAGIPPARIESMLSSGDGTTRFALSRLVPETKFEGTTTMVVSSHPAGGPGGTGGAADEGRRMTMIMRVGIVLAGNLR